jgi:hypothetical protein
MCSARTGSTWGGTLTVLEPAAVLGGPSNALPVSSSTGLRRTVTVPAARSTSSQYRPSTSPRRSPHHAASSTAARYRGVIASTRATTSATEATVRSFARSEPAPGTWQGFLARIPSRTAVFRTARMNRYDWAIEVRPPLPRIASAYQVRTMYGVSWPSCTPSSGARCSRRLRRHVSRYLGPSPSSPTCWPSGARGRPLKHASAH